MGTEEEGEKALMEYHFLWGLEETVDKVLKQWVESGVEVVRTSFS